MAQVESPPTRRPKATLKIHPTPFKPTFLSIPPSPFSPLSPLSPLRQLFTSSTCKSRCTTSTSPNTTLLESNSTRTYLTAATSNVSSAPTPLDLPPPPNTPPRWLWQCHQCHHTYGLGVTRRCLADGHFFCAGTTTIKIWRDQMNPRTKNKGQSRKVIKHRACGSEFDYVGWKTWGRWRRSVNYEKGKRALDEKCRVGESESGLTPSCSSSTSLDSASSSSSSSSSDASSPATVMSTSTNTKSTASTASGKKTPEKPKDCRNTCDYPSECRWGKQFGVHTPVEVAFPSVTVSPLPGEGRSPMPNANSTSPVDGEGILKPENIKRPTTSPKSPIKKSWSDKDTGDFWGALLASATRRKTTPPSSPLASVVEEPEGEEPQVSPKTESALESLKRLLKADDGDAVMFSPQTSPTSTEPSPTTVNPQNLMRTSTMGTATTAMIQATATAPVNSLKDTIGMFKRRSSDRIKARRRKMSFKIECLENVNENGENDDVRTDMAPLRRVRSRDSGYHSHALVVEKM